MLANLDEAPVAAGAELSRSVPVIDLARPTSEVVRAVGEACRDWGFFQIVGHGLSVADLRDALRVTADFFAEPHDRKRLLLRTAENPWGYYDRELTKNVRDKKEIFDIGPDLKGDAGSDDPFEGRTPWPGDMPAFERRMRRHFEACERISHQLVEAICASLGAPATFLRPAFDPAHTSFLRLNYYPVRDPLADEGASGGDLGIHHHTDAGALTVLLQSDVSGLQVYREGLWYGIEPVEGAFVINIGDMFQVWSNDLYRAPIHRVLAMDERDRYSIPFFLNPSYSTIVEPLRQTVSAVRPPRYRGIPWGEFRRRRAEGDFADYGAEVQIGDYRL